MSLTNTGVAVIVAGMPKSGNRMFQSLLEHHGIEAEVHHFGGFEARARQWQEQALTVAVLLPIREAEVHKAGSYKEFEYTFEGRTYEETRRYHYQETLEAASRLRLPIFPVRYSHFVRNPKGVGHQILTWLGVQFIGLNQEVIDGDARWLRKLDPKERLKSDQAKAMQDTPDKSKEIIVPISATLRGSSAAALRRLQQKD